MRWILALALSLAFGLTLAGLAPAQNASPPGAGDPHLLLSKHLAAGLDCAACHAEKPPAKAPAAAQCLNCHGPADALIKKTAGDTPNPHAEGHIGQLPCTACHHVHKQSETYCDKCHSFGLKTP